MLTEKLYLLAAIILTFICSYKDAPDITMVMGGVSIGMLIIFVKRPDIIGK